MASSSGGSGKRTTFLTSESGRAPSAYHVDDQGQTQRARQQHDHGATVTSKKVRFQAFTDTKKQAHAVANVVKEDSRRLNIPPSAALKLAALDGLAKVRLKHGASHVEASDSAIGRGNPHVSGGSVTFPQSGSPLADFSQVVATTRARATGASSAPPITGSTQSQLTPEAQAFNRSAIEQQTGFAKRLLKPR
jgi:hypothetical protein